QCPGTCGSTPSRGVQREHPKVPIEICRPVIATLTIGINRFHRRVEASFRMRRTGQRFFKVLSFFPNFRSEIDSSLLHERSVWVPLKQPCETECYQYPDCHREDV